MVKRIEKKAVVALSLSLLLVFSMVASIIPAVKSEAAAPTFTGTAATINSSGTYTPAGSISLTNSNKTATVSKAASGDATYTPEGTVAAPTISIQTAGSTTTIKNPTSVTVAKTVVTAAPGATAPANNLTYYHATIRSLLYTVWSGPLFPC